MKGAWVLSAVAHGLLLLGAALVYNRWIAVTGPPDYSCSWIPSVPRIDPLPGSPERRRLGAPSPESGPIFGDPPREEEDWDRPLPIPGWYIIEYSEGDGFCGTCISQIYERYQGRVLWLLRPKKPVPCQKLGSYLARLASLANNRFDSRRLLRRRPTSRRASSLRASCRRRASGPSSGSSAPG